MQLHGGSLVAQSNGPNRGSTFTLSLPLAHSLLDEPTSATPPPIVSISSLPHVSPHHMPTSKQLFILLVEDNETTRMIMLRMLGAKHHVVTARSCEEAQRVVALLPNDSVDLLLSDMGLPDGHGSELLPKLRGMCT